MRIGQHAFVLEKWEAGVDPGINVDQQKDSVKSCCITLKTLRRADAKYVTFD